MCEALEELLEFHFKGKIEAGREEARLEGRQEGRLEGRLEGRQEGRLEALLSLVRDGLLDLDEAAKRAGETTERMRELLAN